MAAAALMLLAGCVGSSDQDDAPPHDEDEVDVPSDGEGSGEVIVLAAASLQGVFEELGPQFEDQHEYLEVVFSFAASSMLAQQVVSGAPADVLATASASTMDQAQEYTVDPVVFASNVLVIVVPAGNPGSVQGLADFADPELLIAVCAPEVPCGDAAQRVFDEAGIEPAIDTFAENVTATVNLAISGEVDAALVYATDAISAGDSVEAIEFPEAEAAINENLIAALSDAPNSEGAQAFVDLVLSESGQLALSEHGFRAGQSPP